jgi:hypothetical protein
MQFDLLLAEAWRCAVARPYARPYEENSAPCVSVRRPVGGCPRGQPSRPPGAVRERAGHCLRGPQ